MSTHSSTGRTTGTSLSDDVWCLWEAEAQLGESPVWISEDDSVYFVDIKAPAVLRYGIDDDEHERWAMPEPIGFIAPCSRPREGRPFIAGMKSGIARLDLDAQQPAPIPILDPEPELPGNRINDGKADASGALWFCTMDDDEQLASGSLFRLDVDGTAVAVDGKYAITNGPCISPDGKHLYVADSGGRVVHSFDLDAAGALSNKREFARFAQDDGYPDGMSVDEAGGVWIAHFGGGCVSRFSPQGQRLRQLELPVSQVTSLTFGGHNLDRLFITTARKGLDDDALADQPLAGALFEAEPGVCGLPTARYAG